MGVRAENQKSSQPKQLAAGRFERFRAGPGPVVLLTVAMLFPFVNKAYHIDDPVFIRLAEQIQDDPFHPYRVLYNLDGTVKPAWLISHHPPVNCYLIAVVSAVTGQREWLIHSAFILIAAGCSAIMFLLAKRFCRHPGLAVSAVIVSPAFAVSATTVMGDIPLLFFWLLAVWLAVRFVETRRAGWIWSAAVAASAAAMTKYFGVALVPLLLVYCWPATRRRRMHLLALLMPVVIVAAWSIYSQNEGGGFHPLSAASFSLALKQMIGDNPWSIVGNTASFLGGGMLWPVALLPLIVLRTRNYGLLAIQLLVLAMFVALMVYILISTPQTETASGRAATWLYALMMTGGGVATIAAIRGWWCCRDWTSVLVGLWFSGTIAFCVLFNWTVNIRVILPAVPPATLLAMRWVESLEFRRPYLAFWSWLLAPTAIVSLLVSAADYQLAGASRTFARTTVRDHIRAGRRVLFAGHWGMQYYMEHEGAIPIDYRNLRLKNGDLIVYPTSNVHIFPVNATVRALSDSEGRFVNSIGLQTMEYESGAGFYSSYFGNVPFARSASPTVDRFFIDEYVAVPPTRK